ncbi:MAG: (d)CMP kinase [Clostridia bacterium]|jgi:cytidylate kinase|nr:(d)CMP kinase [Clostridia bacterium]
MRPNIAIDGPAGAGKSTVARLVAQKLGLVYIDTGAMYRALTWKALTLKLPFTEEVLATLAQNTLITFAQDCQGGPQKIFCDGTDVTQEIREPLVTHWVSVLSSYGEVRQELTRLQQKAASSGGVVMDGRDIGTTVLPDAPFKFFLTASLEERSRRRHQELVNKGNQVTLAEIERDIAARDLADQSREIAPLAVAEDAIVIDTTELSIEEVASLIVEKYQQEVQ